MTIPNAICFSADGRTVHFADTHLGLVWRKRLDADGWPEGRDACCYWRTDADGNPTWDGTSRPVPQWTRPGATAETTLGRKG